MRRLKSLTTLTIASRLVFAFVNRMASSSSRSGISKVVFMMRSYLLLESESTTRVFSILTLGAPKTPETRAAVAQDTGLSKESLYKSLMAAGNPEFAAVLKVVRAPGLRLQAAARPRGVGECGER